MLKEFKEFISRGNVVDLAVAVVLGIAFGAVVDSFVKDVLMQIVAAIVGKPDFSSLTFGLGDSEILYGSFLTAVVNFLLIAFAVFLVVKAINTLSNLRRREEVAAEIALPAAEVVLLTEIRDLLAARSGNG